MSNYEFVLYNKFISTRKEKYYQWWYKSERDIDILVSDIYFYIINNVGLYRIIFNGYFIDTKYLRREKIYNFLLKFYSLNDFQFVRLVFNDWNITFFKGNNTDFSLRQFDIYSYLN